MNRYLTSFVSMAGFFAAVALPASATYVLVDDFEAYTAGPLQGQGAWVVQDNDDHFVTAESGLNNVYEVSPGNDVARSAYLPLGVNSISQGTTGTVFYRFNILSEAGVTANQFGLSDSATPAFTFTSYEVQTVFRADSAVDDAQVEGRNAGATDVLTTDITEGEWYNLWIVIDNTADTASYYISQDFDAPVLLQADLTFRNGVAGNALESLLSLAGNPNNSQLGTTYLDDIYIDVSGENLSNPLIPEPSSMALVATGALMAFRRRRTVSA